MLSSPHRRQIIAVFLSLAVAAAGCSNKPNPTATTQAAVANAPVGPAGPTPAAALTPGSAAAGSVTPAPGPAPRRVPAPESNPGLILPRGTRLVVRLGQTIDVRHVTSGQAFTGSLAQPVVIGNTVAVPAGSEATGEVLVAHKRGRFKGRSALALTLTRLSVNGIDYRIDTTTLSRSKKGKGKRSAALIGGGAGMGMLIGGLATGGVGLVVGGLAGGGAGALGAAFTGNRDLVIPAESVVNFRLQDDLNLSPVTTASNTRY